MRGFNIIFIEEVQEKSDVNIAEQDEKEFYTGEISKNSIMI